MQRESENARVWSVELKGIEPIGDDERRGRPRDLLWPWAAATAGILDIVYGIYVSALGLDWVMAAVGAAFGAMLSFLLVGLISLAGQQCGVPTMVIGRAAFGSFGNKLPALFGYLSLVGWETVGTVLSTLAAGAVVHRLAPTVDTTPVKLVVLVVVTVATMVIGIFGCHTIIRISKWLTLACGVLTIVYLSLTADNISFTFSGQGSWTALLGGVSLIAMGSGLTWVNVAADYTRYLPKQASKWKLVTYVTLGGVVVPVVLMTFGTMLVAADKTMIRTAAADPVVALSTALPTWFVIPYLLMAVSSFFIGSVMSLYSSGLALLTLGVKLSRHRTVFIDGAIVMAGGAYVVFGAPIFFAPFQAFLTLMGVPMAGWTGVFLADLWRRRLRYDVPALLSGGYGRLNVAGVASLCVATIIGLGLVTSSDPHVGPLLGYLFTAAARQGSLGSCDVGVFAAFLVGGIAYAILSPRPRTRIGIEIAESASAAS